MGKVVGKIKGILSEESPISIGLAALVFTLAFYVGGMDYNVHANERRLEKSEQKIEKKISDDDEFKLEVIDRLARIETMIRSK